MKTNKYNYFKVIQQNYGQGWEDVSHYETDSQGTPKEKLCKEDGTKLNKFLLSHDFKEYKFTGYPTRVIKRKELNIL